MPGTIFSEKIPDFANLNLVAASGTAFQTFRSILGSGSWGRIDNLLVCNTDVIDHKVQFAIVNGGNTYNIGSIDVPAGQGTGGTAAVDAIPLLIPLGLQGLLLGAQGNYQAKVEVAVTSGQVSIVGWGGFL